jgi:UDP-3-O-[3-hydroxymyristoyl] glucosamine N-acyltransferase
MKTEKKVTLGELANILQGQLAGPADLEIYGVNDLAQANDREISFISEKKYLPSLKDSLARAVITKPTIPVDRPAIIVEQPLLAFAKLLEYFSLPVSHPPVGIHPTAIVESELDKSISVGAYTYIGPSVKIGSNTIIYPNVYIGEGVQIGSDCIIWPGVVIRERVSIGSRVVIHPNSVIGREGFGFNFINGKHQRVPHNGTVIIEDDVEIGACCCIDRAKAGATRIGTGAKIDNQVQIAHNVKIGCGAILVGQVGIAGSAQIGAYAMLGGQVGVVDNVTVGDRVLATARSMIATDIAPGITIGGAPAVQNQQHLREVIAIQRLPEAMKTIKDLTKRVHELEQAIHNK